MTRSPVSWQAQLRRMSASEVATRGVIGFPCTGRREVGRIGLDAELGEVAALNFDFALAAGLVTAADGFDFYAQTARGI